MLKVTRSIQIPLREFQFTFARSSGPGGQNVNKVNTKATLRWPVVRSPSLAEDVRERFLSRYARRITSDGDLVITSQRFRDQGRNVADCLEKLRAMLAEVAVAPRRRKKTKPTKAARERRLREKHQKADKKARRRAVRSDDS
jgi:ribosome-associated protein